MMTESYHIPVGMMILFPPPPFCLLVLVLHSPLPWPPLPRHPALHPSIHLSVLREAAVSLVFVFGYYLLPGFGTPKDGRIRVGHLIQGLGDCARLQL